MAIRARLAYSSFHASVSFFFFNDTATTEIYTLSLHDALPIYDAFAAEGIEVRVIADGAAGVRADARGAEMVRDRKSTRLNSSHLVISYAVFCLKKKKLERIHHSTQNDPLVTRRHDSRAGTHHT